MALADRLQEDLHRALRAGDRLRVSTIRLARAAIHNAAIERGRLLADPEVEEILAREIKRRREAIEAYSRGGRDDLVQKETLELAILSEYLPPQLNETELRAIVAQAVAEIGATGPQDVGRVMGAVMPNVKGRGRKPVKRAHSAGGVVFRRDGDGPAVLLLRHESGKWMLPKGTIEPGETPEAVALREVREETSISNVRVVADLGEERYYFFWRAEDTFYDKSVRYYLLEFLGGEEATPQSEEGFVACEWVPLSEALERIKYKETREVVRRAKAYLEHKGAQSDVATG